MWFVYDIYGYGAVWLEESAQEALVILDGWKQQWLYMCILQILSLLIVSNLGLLMCISPVRKSSLSKHLQRDLWNHR